MNAQGQVLFKEHFATGDYQDADSYADALASSVKKLIHVTEAEMQSICWQGYRAPNGISKRIHRDPPNLKFMWTTPLVQMLQKRLDLKSIVLTNRCQRCGRG